MNRALSLLLAAVLLIGAVPGLTMPASAHWADPYLDQLVDWGVMRADQTSNPDKPMTRAEFMAVINRAYGYTEMGEIPFTDVSFDDWFYDDVAIAYNAGYMAGTSETTASPNLGLTREQAVCILARNMMMKDTPGENLAFSDARKVSGWARGLVKTAVDSYIVSGYPDNTFGAQDSVSKGQVAALVVRCVGTPLNTPGEHVLGDVFDNVTITSPNVTLRNTTISGDLYISGGVGLGGIKLENVKVLGRIIVSGTGESEAGDASVVMRNVSANEMLVDNMRNKAVTIRADGITEIENTIVRTQAYLEDNNTDDKGLMHITLEGEPGTHLTLAGRIKEVVNKTPSSTIQVAKGTVKKLTVDEAATNSVVQIDRNTEVKELNLDVATSVTGEGDIGQLNINAPGCVVSMLPDKIYIRPGLTANVSGVIMDHVAAEEGSIDPRLLSGYPAARDIAPTAFRADFSTNKKGTVYWAVSTISDGSISEDNLIAPPSYGSKALRNGSVAAPTGGTEISAQVTGLTVGGSYYLSAILVDDQNQRSPVKVISFSTPDNTVPAFGQGYPYMSRITRDVAQVTVMPTKSCKLYYALLPQGAQAPTINNLKSASVTGNVGYGVRDVTKNTEEVFTVNNQRLEELKNYTLYLWLTDVDGANSSAIQSLPVPVPDETPPIVDPIPYSVAQGTTGNTIAMRSGMNEKGTIYWAIVPQGEPYPLPNKQSNPLEEDNNLNEDGEAISSKLNTDYAKLCVMSGNGALARGSVSVGTPGTEVSFNVTGLQPETAYDLYYVGQDTSKNFSEVVGCVTVSTLDESGPIVSQRFVDTNDIPYEKGDLPPADATVILDFSEHITVDGTTDILELTDDPTTLANKLKANFILYQIDPESRPSASPVVDLTGLKPEEKEAAKQNSAAWVDYDAIKVQASETNKGHVEVVYKNGSAISLADDTTYYFELKKITDTSIRHNKPVNSSGDPADRIWYNNTVNTEHNIPQFKTSPPYTTPTFKLDSPDIVTNPDKPGATMMLNFGLNPTGSTLYYRIAPKDKPISAKIKVLKDVTFGTTTIPAGRELDSFKNKDEFFAVIQAQTDLEELRGQLYDEEGNATLNGDTGKLTYYEVIENKNDFRNGIANLSTINPYYPENFPGSVKYDLGGGIKEHEIPGKDAAGADRSLLPKTEYYIYIVLENFDGASRNLSQVYIYNFKTDEAKKPQLELVSNNDGTVILKTSKNKVPSNLAWIVITENNGLKWLEALDFKGEGGYSYVTTVKEALVTPYSASVAYPNGAPPDAIEKEGYTVFDVYASDDQKKVVSDLIYNAVVNNESADFVKKGTTTTQSNKDFQSTIDWFNNAKDPTFDAPYMILVAGHNSAHENSNTNTGSDKGSYVPYDSFRALSPIRNLDRTPPKLKTGSQGFVASMDYYEDTEKFSGDVTITFNRTVYWKWEGFVYSVQPGSGDPTRNGSSGTVGILYENPNKNNITTLDSPGTNARSTFTFHFSNFDKTYANFLPNGEIAAQSGEPSGQDIRIFFYREAAEDIKTPDGSVIKAGQPYLMMTFPTVDENNQEYRDKNQWTHYAPVTLRGSGSARNPEIVIDPASLSLGLGESKLLEARVTNLPAGMTVKSWTWTSTSNQVTVTGTAGTDQTNTATVKVLNTAPGVPVTITATLTYRDANNNEYRLSKTVNVQVNTPTISISPRNNGPLPIGDTLQLSSNLKNGGAGRVTWESSSDSVAAVDSDGKVTGKAQGTATITATYCLKDNTKTTITDSVTITVVPKPKNIKVKINGAPGGTTINTGTYNLTATVTIDGVEEKNSSNILWQSSNPTVATISPDGTLTVQGSDRMSFKITATYNPAVYPDANIEGDSFERQIQSTVGPIQPSKRP
jgi:hypothetical protein